MINLEEEAAKGKAALRGKVNIWKKGHPDWEDAGSVQYVKGKVKAKTFSGYLSTLPVFFTWLGVDDPDQLIRGRVEQLKDEDVKIRFYYEDKLVEFRDFLTGVHYAGSTVKMMCSRVAGFFSNNRYSLELDNDFWETAEQGSDIAEALQTAKIYPDIDEVRLIVDVADNKMATAVLLGFQNGLVNVDIVGLSWENLGSLDYETEAREFIGYRGKRSKTGEKYTGVLTPDILSVLRPFWIECGKPRSGWVFEGYKNTPLDPKTINKAFKELALKSLIPERANALSFKTLRDAYHANLVDADIEEEKKDKLFGHKRRGSKNNYSIANVVTTYQEHVYPLVSVNGWRLQGRAAKADELEGKVINLEKALTQVENENVAYKTRIDGLQTRFSELEQKIEAASYLGEDAQISKLLLRVFDTLSPKDKEAYLKALHYGESGEDHNP